MVEEVSGREEAVRKIATSVADRCHGKRKPGQAPQRYAIIWQAARLGALEAMRAADTYEQSA